MKTNKKKDLSFLCFVGMEWFVEWMVLPPTPSNWFHSFTHSRIPSTLPRPTAAAAPINHFIQLHWISLLIWLLPKRKNKLRINQSEREKNKYIDLAEGVWMSWLRDEWVRWNGWELGVKPITHNPQPTQRVEWRGSSIKPFHPFTHQKLKFSLLSFLELFSFTIL